MTQPNDASKKSPRTFQCRDQLWETFEQMARELECSIDYLINEAMKQYARQRSYGAGAGGRTPFPGSRDSGQTDVNINRPPMQASPPTAPAVPMARGATPPIPPAVPAQSRLPPPPPPSGGRNLPLPPPPTASRGHGGHGAPPPPMGRTSGGPPPLPRGPASMPPMHTPSSSVPTAPPPMGGPMGAPMQSHPMPPPPPPMAAPPMPSPMGGMHMGMQQQFIGGLTAIYQGERTQVNKEKFIIGRGRQTSDLTIKDPNVSRQHAMVEFQNGVFYMVDLGSTNGVEYHGQRVTRKAIAEGDIFRICDHEVAFTFR